MATVSDSTAPACAAQPFVRWFDEITWQDVALVGGKNASLGELCRELGPRGVNLAEGFAITAEAYRLFLHENRLDRQIRCYLAGLDARDIATLQDRGRRIRQAILAAELPVALREPILTAYRRLSGGEQPVDVAVRTSATAEDLPDASCAGQLETDLYGLGEPALL
ncbi:MAG: PEP/pyruvate-binding domain-containing protein, partial [Pirellulaceae bacterium]